MMGVPLVLMGMGTWPRRTAWQADPLIRKAPEVPITRKANISGLILANRLLLFASLATQVAYSE